MDHVKDLPPATRKLKDKKLSPPVLGRNSSNFYDKSIQLHRESINTLIGGGVNNSPKG